MASARGSHGERDPVTPPPFAPRILPHLSNALHVVIPYGGHYGNGPCPIQIEADFLRPGSVQGVDTSCLAGIQPEPFLLEVPKEGIKPI